MNDIEYAELKTLAENDIELYEKKRQELLASFIDSFSSNTLKEHLRNIQNKIDDQRAIKMDKHLE